MGPRSNRTGLEMGRRCWSRRASRSNRRRAHLRERGRLVGDNGILIVSRRRAIQGGSYRGFVSLTRTVLWLLSLGTSDMEYRQASARTTGGHPYAAPDLFTPETPMAHQGMTDQVILLRTPGCLRTVFVPRLEQTRNGLRPTR